MAVGTYALTTLANLKSALGISGSSEDAVLESMVDRATALIESACDRKLKSRTHREWCMPAGERTLTIDHPPISNINTVSYGRQTCMTIPSDTASSDVLATVGFDGSEVRLYKVNSAGSASTATVATASYPTSTTIVNYINASVAGWSATLSRNAYANSMYRFGGRGVTDAPCNVDFPRDNVSQYEVEFDIGLIHITSDRFPGIRSDGAHLNTFPSGFYPVFVEYVGGYSTVPSDLEQACIEIATDIYNDRGNDKNMASEGLGDYNYSRQAAEQLIGMRANLLAAYTEIR